MGKAQCTGTSLKELEMYIGALSMTYEEFILELILLGWRNTTHDNWEKTKCNVHVRDSVFDPELPQCTLYDWRDDGKGTFITPKSFASYEATMLHIMKYYS